MARPPMPVEDRIKRAVTIDPDTGCWVWQRAKNREGYGRMSVPNSHRAGGGVWFAHRVSYEVFVGPIPEGLVLDHLCRNRACVNPDHLEPVTHKTNLRRGETLQAANLLKTHCPYGHEFSPENTRIIPRGRRCIACERRRARESKARKREAGR